MPRTYDDVAARLAFSGELCQQCGTTRQDHGAEDHEFNGYDALDVMADLVNSREATPAEQQKLLPMGGSYECSTCGGDVRGCMC